ncbi:thiopeptide-type bacteriocin biosynthesis protein [Flavobacterium sp. Fl-318]|uniref:Thiopeptide-type bacteriocin biosynthesis protein n=1 Tax=Flavobacterium cupriresistens TaxID=2893885 RepID=A0ABU4RF92_9FLAO|nr:MULTISPECIES: thiopeptide-type bacteriocin biosynthesis protein [unclassified Flavobacterium]MDX6191267.1 thiopeptide-type bacteriocin biosynthesis protein [Flavobacterium sp. Fl-318]UFH42414.1 thiopeptide-type bacteriocin biosynthesis protein [Flavobacterium sp. F-323]
MQRDFCLGSEWLYYKIYTGVKTSDAILLEKLEPVITHLQHKKIITKWFFIRYRDPEEHLRIRFLIENPTHLSVVIQAFYSVFKELIQQNVIWTLQADTYKREIERYGKTTMITSESLFYRDSEMILQYIQIKPLFKQQELPLLFSFYAIDSFLNSFQLSNQEKLSLMDRLQTSFKQEFESDKEQKKELSRNYQSVYQQMHKILSLEAKNHFGAIRKIVDAKTKKSNKLALEIKAKIEIPLNQFLSAHIHMMLNRQYNSKQRTYELLIYDHLFRYYKNQNFVISSL